MLQKVTIIAVFLKETLPKLAIRKSLSTLQAHMLWNIKNTILKHLLLNESKN